MSWSSLAGYLGLGLVWLFFLSGLFANYWVLRASLRAKEGERVPSSLGFVPGLAGAVAVFLTLPELAKLGIDVPWPWLWIVLPVFLDPYCLGSILVLAWGSLWKRR